MPPRGPWASCLPRQLSHGGWSLGCSFLFSLLMVWEPHLRFLGCLSVDDAPHFITDPPSPQIFCTYLKQELLCLPVILFPSSQMKRSLLAICLLFGFLSRNETEGNRNSAPSHVTSPCTEAHLLLFAPKTTTPEVNDCH